MYQNPGKGTRTFPRNPDFLFQPQPGEWFTLEWIAQGSRLIGKVNGQETASIVDANLAAAGHVGVTAWTQSPVEFRKIEIKELDALAAVQPPPRPPVAPIKDAAPFPAEEGFTPLFNGKDLAGWKNHRIFSGDWRVEKGVLTGSSAKAGMYLLQTEEPQAKDFHLRVERASASRAMRRSAFEPIR